MANAELEARLAGATSRLAADREFCKVLLTLSVAMIGVYVTLLTWALPKGVAAASIMNSRTMICLALPALDFVSAIVSFALGYVGAGFGKSAPSTVTEMQEFHDIQIRWIRSGGIFLIIGLVTAFAMLGRVLLSLSKSSDETLEYVSAVGSIIIALIATRTVYGVRRV